MAIGSNTLGLLFKLGVDAGDAKKQLDAVAKGIDEGIAFELKKLNLVTKDTGAAFDKMLVPINQARAGVQQVFSGDVTQGAISLTRALGPLGIALAGIAAAAAGVTFALKGAISAAQDIGTKSKEDFDELQKKVHSVGLSITELQRGMAEGILGALDQISGATTAFFAKVLEKDGKALIALLKEIAKTITDDLIPLVDKFGDRISNEIAKSIAIWRTLKQFLEEPAPPFRGLEAFKESFKPQKFEAFPTLRLLDEQFAKTFKDVKAEIAAIKTVATAPLEKVKKGRKDITEAALEQAKAEHALSLVRQEAAVADREINQDQAKGLITQEEGAKRRLAVLAEVQKAELALLDARKKAIETDPTLGKLPRERARQLDDIETQRAAIRLRAADAEDQERRKTIEADKKLHDAFTRGFAKLKLQWIDYAEFVHKQADAIVADIARQAQPVPGGGGVGPIPGAPRPIALPIPTSAIKDLSDLLAHLHEQMVQNINDAIKLGGAWGGLTQSLKEFFSLQNIGDQFVLMMKSVLDVFIQTGHTGPAVLRQLVAGVLRAIATMSAEWGAFFLLMAIGFAALGAWADAAKFALAGAGLVALAAGLGFAASKVGPSQAGAAAGAGGFGGGETTPSPVNIGLGGASTLAISTAQFARAQIDAINNLNNKISSMSPGDVVTVAADQKPEAFATGTLEAGRRSGAFTREFMQISGARA